MEGSKEESPAIWLGLQMILEVLPVM